MAYSYNYNIPKYNPMTEADMEAIYAKHPMPTYTPPTYDTSRLRFLGEQQAAPGIRSLRRGVSEALGKSYENPNVSALAKREALGGFGEGLEQVYGGARRTAQAMYAPEYAGQEQAGKMSYEALMDERYKKLTFAIQAEQNKRLQEYNEAKEEAQRLTPISGSGGNIGEDFWTFKAREDKAFAERTKTPAWTGQPQYHPSTQFTPQGVPYVVNADGTVFVDDGKDEYFPYRTPTNFGGPIDYNLQAK